MAKITVAFMRDVYSQMLKEEISYSRMVEMLNEEAVRMDDFSNIKPIPIDENDPYIQAIRNIEKSRLIVKDPAIKGDIPMFYNKDK
jgi:hypothetical protein